MMTILFHTNDDASIVKLANYIQELNDRHVGKQITYTIEIKKNRPIRSLDQNRYYWAILKHIGAHTGYTTDDLHKFYKLEFNNKYVFGKLIEESTANLDSKEFTIYVNQVKEHAKSFHGIKFKELADKDYETWEQIGQHNYNQMFAAL